MANEEADAEGAATEANVEELQRRLTEHFEDTNEKQKEDPPMIRTFRQPIAEEWNRHQAIHKPYEAWCPHCVVAWAVRRNHPPNTTRAHVVPDGDASAEGPVTISMDYTYLRDRTGRCKDLKWNVPCLIVVENRYGRCWAYHVPNEGHMGL